VVVVAMVVMVVMVTVVVLVLVLLVLLVGASGSADRRQGASAATRLGDLGRADDGRGHSEGGQDSESVQPVHRRRLLTVDRGTAGETHSPWSALPRGWVGRPSHRPRATARLSGSHDSIAPVLVVVFHFGW
jgi:hypothetical protein